jgi:DNA-binding MarR family transcriptional regulator
MMSTAQSVLSALGSYKLKPTGQNEYRCNSPLRPGADGMNFSIKIEGDETGAWFDHKENRGGSLYDLAKQLGIETPRANVASTKRSYAGLADYARAHGVEEIEFKRWKWKHTTVEGRAALEFPTESGKRWRFVDGEKPRFKSERGYKSCWYGLTREIGESVGDDLPLVICNGEPSVVSAQAHNIPAVCVTAGEKGTIPPHLIQELKDTVGICPVIVALDCDDTGRKSALGMVALLNAEGFTARAVDLGLSGGGDLGDFCVLHSGGAWSQLSSLPNLTPVVSSIASSGSRDYGIPKDKLIGHGSGWIMIHSDNLKYLPNVTWLLKPYIPSQGLIVIYGPSGTGKSFLALWFALQISQQKNVLYMAYEGEWGYRSRVVAAQSYYHYGRGLDMTLGQVDLMSDEEFMQFIDSARKVNPSVVFVDTVARSMGDLDENSTHGMNTYIRRCNQLATELNCAVVLVHHTSKGGYVERGNSALRGACDLMIRLEDADDRTLVECAKTKDGKPFPSFHINLHPVDIGLVDEYGQPVQTPVAVIAKDDDVSESVLTKNQFLILSQINLFGDEGMSYTQIKEIAGGMSPSSMNNVIASLKKKGFIEQAAKRDPYTITDAGKEAMGAGKPWVAPVDTQSQSAPLSTPKSNGRLPGMPNTESRYHEAGL